MGVAEMHPLVSEGAKAKPALSAQPDSLKMPAWPAWPGAVMLQQATAQSLRSRLRATQAVPPPPPQPRHRRALLGTLRGRKLGTIRRGNPRAGNARP